MDFCEIMFTVGTISNFFAVVIIIIFALNFLKLIENQQKLKENTIYEQGLVLTRQQMVTLTAIMKQGKLKTFHRLDELKDLERTANTPDDIRRRSRVTRADLLERNASNAFDDYQSYTSNVAVTCDQIPNRKLLPNASKHGSKNS